MTDDRFVSTELGYVLSDSLPRDARLRNDGCYIIRGGENADAATPHLHSPFLSSLYGRHSERSEA